MPEQVPSVIPQLAEKPQSQHELGTACSSWSGKYDDRIILEVDKFVLPGDLMAHRHVVNDH